MTISTIRKIGNSTGVILSQNVLGPAGLSEGDRVKVTVTDEGVITIAPVDRKTAFVMSVARQYLRDHRRAFERLKDR